MSAAADRDNRVARSENWGVIPRNTIGSPVAVLRDGPVVPGDNGRPPYGNGSLGGTDLPAVRFEINPNLGTSPDRYTVAVWRPDAVQARYLDQWSPFLDATTSGSWYLTGGETA
ncbi:hypothetical protein [Streptomyces triticiradicis]|uniref:hypothetical protein n=1 Tax=Streptomyces triticiradicis TaxID=2651189 RepID=UPI001788AF6A|nr:hypothetical protein [Streptomyces triticiradicis]